MHNCDRSPSVRKTWSWFVVVLVAGLGVSAVGQYGEPAPTTEPARSVSISDLEARQKAAESSTALDEATRQRVAGIYGEAIAAVRVGQGWQAKADTLAKQGADAPRIVAELRAAEERRLPPVAAPVAGMPLKDLEARLAQSTAELTAARDSLIKMDGELASHADRRRQATEGLPAAKQRLDGLVAGPTVAAPTVAAPPTDPPEVVEAVRARRAAQQLAVRAEIGAYEVELATYEERGQLLRARRDDLSRQVTALEAQVTALQEATSKTRLAEAQAAASTARVAEAAAAELPAEVQELAGTNAELAQDRSNTAKRIQATTETLGEREQWLSSNRADFQSLQARVKAGGLTHGVSLWLRRRRAELPDAIVYRRGMADRRLEISRVDVRIIDLEASRVKMGDPDQAAEARLGTGAMSDADRAERLAQLREYVLAQREQIDALIRDYETYFNRLLSLNEADRQTAALIDEYSRFINERILWTRSAGTISLEDVHRAVAALRWLTASESWLGVGQSLGPALKRRLALVVVGGLGFGALVVLRRRLRGRLREMGGLARKSYLHAFGPTLRACFYTVALAVTWPLPFWLIGRPLAEWSTDSAFSAALGAGLCGVGWVVFLVEAVRHTCDADGLGVAHFGWSPSWCMRVRRHLGWLVPCAVPMVFGAGIMAASGHEEFDTAPGRIAAVVGLLLVAAYAYAVWWPSRGSGGSSRRGFGAYLLPVFLVGVPVVLAGESVAGYYYSAVQEILCCHATVWMALILAVAYGAAKRWELLFRRRLAIDQVRRRREAAGGEAGDLQPGESDIEVDLPAIGVQTHRLFRTALVVALVVSLWAIWGQMIPALGVFDRITLWNTATAEGGVAAVSLGDLLTALVVLMVTGLAVRNLPGLVEILLLQHLPTRPGERYAVVTVMRYVLTAVGVVLAFGMVGIGWGKVQWLAAAITVGLGFGLQEIFANFVSGLIILFERPVRVGDIVSVGDLQGRVTRIRIRATTILDWDRRELLVPNKEFITAQLINWTLSDPVTRVIVPVGIAYGSDTALARELLLKVARDCPLALRDPAPVAMFREFGDNSLNFELRVFIPNRDVWQEVIHHLHMAIDQSFRQAGIEIAFPQRDIHIRSIHASLPLTGMQKNTADQPASE